MGTNDASPPYDNDNHGDAGNDGHDTEHAKIYQQLHVIIILSYWAALRHLPKQCWLTIDGKSKKNVDEMAMDIYEQFYHDMESKGFFY